LSIILRLPRADAAWFKGFKHSNRVLLLKPKYRARVYVFMTLKNVTPITRLSFLRAAENFASKLHFIFRKLFTYLSFYGNRDLSKREKMNTLIKIKEALIIVVVFLVALFLGL